MLVLALVGGLGLVAWLELRSVDPIETGPEITYKASQVRVIDGDTLEVAGEVVRIANIDTPEMPPKAQCAREASGARQATARLEHLARQGGLSLERTGVDRYGRTLAYVEVRGADVGQTLIRSGLARPWEGRRRSWCD